jgi:hypothetical protein
MICDSDGDLICTTSGRFGLVTETKNATVLANSFKVLEQVRDVRAAQKAYFKNRTQDNLLKSKQAEKELDRLLLSLDVIRISDLGKGVALCPPIDSLINDLDDIATQLEDFRQLPNARKQLRSLINDLRANGVGVSLADTNPDAQSVQPLIIGE